LQFSRILPFGLAQGEIMHPYGYGFCGFRGFRGFGEHDFSPENALHEKNVRKNRKIRKNRRLSGAWML